MSKLAESIDDNVVYITFILVMFSIQRIKTLDCLKRNTNVIRAGICNLIYQWFGFIDVQIIDGLL